MQGEGEEGSWKERRSNISGREANCGLKKRRLFKRVKFPSRAPVEWLEEE